MSQTTIALIVECTREGLESLVCPQIVRLLGAVAGVDLNATVYTMTNKKLLIRDAAATVKLAMKEGCHRAVILWDENPPWTPEQDFADDRCWHIERDQILKSIAAAGVGRSKVGLVCIEREFETWLLHDHRLLRAVISTPAHKAKVKRIPDPVLIDDPKAALMSRFRSCKTRYNPDIAAKKFAACLDNLDHLQRCNTFRYFAQQVLGKMPKGWKPFEYAPKGPKKL